MTMSRCRISRDDHTRRNTKTASSNITKKRNVRFGSVVVVVALLLLCSSSSPSYFSPTNVFLGASAVEVEVLAAGATCLVYPIETYDVSQYPKLFFKYHNNLSTFFDHQYLQKHLNSKQDEKKKQAAIQAQLAEYGADLLVSVRDPNNNEIAHYTVPAAAATALGSSSNSNNNKEGGGEGYVSTVKRGGTWNIIAVEPGKPRHSILGTGVAVLGDYQVCFILSQSNRQGFLSRLFSSSSSSSSSSAAGAGSSSIDTMTLEQAVWQQGGSVELSGGNPHVVNALERLQQQRRASDPLHAHGNAGSHSTDVKHADRFFEEAKEKDKKLKKKQQHVKKMKEQDGGDNGKYESSYERERRRNYHRGRNDHHDDDDDHFTKYKKLGVMGVDESEEYVEWLEELDRQMKDIVAGADFIVERQRRMTITSNSIFTRVWALGIVTLCVLAAVLSGMYKAVSTTLKRKKLV